MKEGGGLTRDVIERLKKVDATGGKPVSQVDAAVVREHLSKLGAVMV